MIVQIIRQDSGDVSFVSCVPQTEQIFEMPL